jgi:tubulin polyglutamylase TTLL1
VLYHPQTTRRQTMSGATNRSKRGRGGDNGDPPPLKWKTDMYRDVIISNFEAFGWIKAKDDDPDWNIYWATVSTVKQIFNPDSRYRLTDGQLLNHFPNHYELTRKDLMVKNIKRHRKELLRDGKASAAAEVDFLPVTYMLPSDYSLFLEEFRRCPSAWWIMKPSNAAQVS